MEDLIRALTRTKTQLRCYAPDPPRRNDPNWTPRQKYHGVFLQVELPGHWQPTGRILSEFDQAINGCAVVRCDCGKITEYRKVDGQD